MKKKRNKKKRQKDKKKLSKVNEITINDKDRIVDISNDVSDDDSSNEDIIA